MRSAVHGTMPTPVVEAGERGTVADYIASMTGDLALLARRNGLDTLGYILEMARLEAQQESDQSHCKP